jgi:hypothetical protein
MIFCGAVGCSRRVHREFAFGAKMRKPPRSNLGGESPPATPRAARPRPAHVNARGPRVHPLAPIGWARLKSGEQAGY